MLKNQIRVEIKKAFDVKNIVLWTAIIVILPLIRFFIIKDGYIFFDPVEVFQEMVSAIIPLLFPALTLIIYLPNIIQEQANNYITYTRPRINLNTYLLSKFIVNAFFTGIIIFLMIFLTFLFAVYIEPQLNLIGYQAFEKGSVIPSVTFSQLLSQGYLVYGLTYALWVAVNAVVYTSLAFFLLIIIENVFVALSVPFLYYHIFNFIAGIFSIAQFSPLSTIFPFNIEQQPLWTVLVPLAFLILVNLGLYIYVIRKREDWNV